MAVDAERLSSRRHVLTAALGALGGLVASKLGRPEAAEAAQGDPVTVGGTFQGTNFTSFENTSPNAYSLRAYHATDGVAFEAKVDGAGRALDALAPAAGARALTAHTLDMHAIVAISETTTPDHANLTTQNVAVAGYAGDVTNAAEDLNENGVYGYCDTSAAYAAGVWGDSNQGIGVVGTGDWGVFGGGNVGVYAAGPVALHTVGKVQFAGRSGHNYVSAGQKYKDVTIAGMTSGADGIAVLRTHVTGYYVSAVVSYTGKIRVYLNKTAGSKIYFNYVVLN